VCLYAEAEPAKFERVALRWLGRYVTEGKAVSLRKHRSRSLRSRSCVPGSEVAAKLLTELARR
jgi:hypothetical protein